MRASDASVGHRKLVEDRRSLVIADLEEASRDDLTLRAAGLLSPAYRRHSRDVSRSAATSSIRPRMPPECGTLCGRAGAPRRLASTRAKPTNAVYGPPSDCIRQIELRIDTKVPKSTTETRTQVVLVGGMAVEPAAMHGCQIQAPPAGAVFGEASLDLVDGLARLDRIFWFDRKLERRSSPRSTP